MLNDIILQSNYRDAGVEGAEQLFVKYGERLISGSLQAAVFSVSGTLKRDMAEIIYLIGKLSKEVGVIKYFKMMVKDIKIFIVINRSCNY